MSLRPQIMLKYSGVIGNGSRSPANYFEQIHRCASDSGVDNFATINNQFSLGGARGAAQLKMEVQLLSHSIRNRVARTRARELRGHDVVVFTRAGALLNLKLLLGMSRVRSSHRLTAVGACALHANDYLESLETERLAVGPLPVAAELAAFWETTNARPVGPLLNRCFYIYDVLLRQDERIATLFASEHQPPPTDIDFAGLSYKSYFALLFGIYAAASSSALEHLTSNLDIANIARMAGLSDQQFEIFVGDRAWTADKLTPLVEDLSDLSAFTKRVCDISWCSDLRSLRNRPLLRLNDGRFIVLDVQFLIENASAGIQWQLRHRLSRRGSDIFGSLWGGLVETFVHQMLRHYHGHNVCTSVGYAHGEIDAVITLPAGSQLLFEIKAGFLPEAAKASRSENDLAAALARNFVRSDTGAPKGVTQLAQAAVAFANRHSSSSFPRIYPVLVVEDPVLQSLAMNAYLDDQFRMALAGNTNGVAPLTVMTIDELQAILPVVASGAIAWQEILEEHFVNGKAAVNSLDDTMYDLSLKHGFDNYPDTFLQASSAKLWSLVDEVYRPQA